MSCTCSDQWTGIVPDHGLSAYAINHRGATDYPHDPSDLCRCLHVSPQPPEHMRSVSAKWAVLVDHWTELAELLRAEHPSGQAPRTYARMKELMGRPTSPPETCSRCGRHAAGGMIRLGSIFVCRNASACRRRSGLSDPGATV